MHLTARHRQDFFFQSSLQSRTGGTHWLAYGFRDKRLTAYLFIYLSIWETQPETSG